MYIIISPTPRAFTISIRIHISVHGEVIGMKQSCSGIAVVYHRSPGAHQLCLVSRRKPASQAHSSSRTELAASGRLHRDMRWRGVRIALADTPRRPSQPGEDTRIGEQGGREGLLVLVAGSHRRLAAAVASVSSAAPNLRVGICRTHQTQMRPLGDTSEPLASVCVRARIERQRWMSASVVHLTGMERLPRRRPHLTRISFPV